MHVKSLMLIGCLLAMAACGEGTATAPAVPLNQQFTLGPGDSVLIQDAAVHLAFLRVTSDSRCPTDVVCVQAGDAVVHVRAIDGGSVEYELHTGDRSRTAVTHGPLRVELVQLQPSPLSSRPVEPANYRATFVATFLAGR